MRAIDKHPQRKNIIDAILQGKSDRQVAKMAGVSHVAVCAYRNQVLKPQLDTAAKAHKYNKLAEKVGVEPEEGGQVAALALRNPDADMFFERSNLIWNKSLTNLERAERGEKVNPQVAPMLNQAHRNLELYGKARGVLRDGPATSYQQINISVGAPPSVEGCADDDVIELEPMK